MWHRACCNPAPEEKCSRSRTVGFRSIAFQFLHISNKAPHGPVSKIPQLVVAQIRESICRPLFQNPKRAFSIGVFELGAEIRFEFIEPRRMVTE